MDFRLQKSLEHEKELCDIKNTQKIRLLNEKFNFNSSLNLLNKFSGVYKKINEIYREMKNSIKNLENLERLSVEALQGSQEIVTFQVIASSGQKLKFYLPNSQLKLSQVLQTTLKDEWQTKEPSFVNATEYNEEVIKEFFDYLATQFPPQITQENVMALIHIANRFDVPSLIPLCLKFITKNSNLAIIPELLQMGFEMKRKELIDCCEKIFDDYAEAANKRGSEPIMSLTKERHLPILIVLLLFNGIESKRIEMLWFTIRNGMKKNIFKSPNLLLQCLENIFPSIDENFSQKQMNLDMTKAFCKQLIVELADLSYFKPFPSFNNELGKIEFHKLPSSIPAFYHLNHWIPLTLNIAEEISEKDYFDFIGKLIELKISIKVNRPAQWKQVNEAPQLNINLPIYNWAEEDVNLYG